MSRSASRRFLLVVSIATLGLLGLFSLVDAGRPWRAIQQDFFQREADTLERRLAATLEDRGVELASLEAAVETANERFATRRSEVEALEARIRQLDHEAWRAETRGRQAEALGDTAEQRDSRREIEALDELRGQLHDQLAALRGGLDTATASLAEAHGALRPLQTRLDALEASSWWRGLPVVGRFAPPIAVQSLVPKLVTAATGPPAVERCITCHLTTVRADLADTAWPPPLRPHPRPDLYVAADSFHPASTFGCVACHGGDGRATDFGRAGHSPRDEAQAQDWSERLGFRRGPATAPKLHPRDLMEVGCGSCHTRATGVAEAPSLATGRQLRRALGCDGCHTDSTTAAPPPAPAPSLVGLPEKTERRWLVRRLAASETHPGLKPFFAEAPSPASLPEATPTEASKLARTELAAMVRALWVGASVERAPSPGLPSPPAGDPERGRQLFDTLGCRGCHALASAEDPMAATPSLAPSLGPARGRNAAWLFAFLSDPRGVEPTTRMPDPRLSEREAADLAAMLQAPSETDGSPSQGPVVDPELRDRLLLAALEAQGTLEGSAAQLASLDEDARTLALGRQLLTTRGCHGCHEVPGLEDIPAPATPWTKEALAPLAEGVFRHPELAFALPAEDDRALRIALLADASVSELSLEGTLPSPADSDFARGAELIAELGCRGCHGFEGQPSVLVTQGVAGADGIPALDHLGSKLRPSWLTTALRQPSEVAIRPWLTFRMPRYRLAPEEIDLLIRTLSRRSPVPWVVEELPAADRQVLEAGRALYEMMQCDGCHHGTETLLPGPPAPDYGTASQRLRPDWVLEWILEPDRFAPGSGMPTRFMASRHGGYDSSFLVGSLEMPMFGAQYRRLRRAFDDEGALLTHLEDPYWVAEALRAHLWTKTPGSTVPEPPP